MINYIAPSLGKNGAGANYLRRRNDLKNQNLNFVIHNEYPSGSKQHHLPEMDGSPHLQDLFYYDPLVSVSKIICPTLIIDAREEELWDVKENGFGAYQRLNSSIKKYVVLNGSHYDVYGKSSAEAIKQAILFLNENFSNSNNNKTASL